MKLKSLLFICLPLLLSSCGGTPQKEPDKPKEEYGDPSLTNNNFIHYYGRTYINNNKDIEFHFSGTGFEIKVDVKDESNYIILDLKSKLVGSYTNQFIGLYVDDTLKEKKELNELLYNIIFFENLPVGQHYIKLLKLNEKNVGSLYLGSIEIKGADWLVYDKKFDKRIEFYGDSITCGYGVLGKTTDGFQPISEDASFAYPYLTAHALNYDYSIVSASGISLAMNAFNSEYYFKHLYPTYDGTHDFKLDDYKVDIAVINLGTNDNTKLKTYAGAEKENKANAFYNEYLDLALKIKTNNPDCKFLLCYDMMTPFDGFLVTAIGGVCDYLNSEYDECAYSLQFQIDYGGSDGHPGKDAHKANADIISKYITDNLLGE